MNGILDAAVRTALLRIGQNRRENAERCRTTGALLEAVGGDRVQGFVHRMASRSSLEFDHGRRDDRMVDTARRHHRQRIVDRTEALAPTLYAARRNLAVRNVDEEWALR